MTLEEDYSYILDEEPYVDETRYTLGVRGIESIEAERVDGQSTSGVTLNQKYRSFPIHDGHGNMICTLERDGTDFVLKNEKRYDVWGGVRSYSNGGTVLNPNKQYCANLGHTTDQESGLIYMRARYYEPWTGRFISEDPARAGRNWYRYAGNNPISKIDREGTTDEWAQDTKNGASAALLALGLFLVIASAFVDRIAARIVAGGMIFMAAWFNFSEPRLEEYSPSDQTGGLLARYLIGTISTIFYGAVATMMAPVKPSDGSVASKYVAVLSAHCGNIALFIALTNLAEGYGL